MNNIEQRVRSLWETLHTMPEPGMAEVRTSAFLAKALEHAGYEVTTKIGGGTGVTGNLFGNRTGPVLALRADMDALLHEVDGEKRAIHSCGHDANCAMVLSAAEELARRGIGSGTLKIIFQPAEETLDGAQSMIRAGVIDNVDMLLGIHLRPPTEAPLGTAMPALYHGASAVADVTISGKAAHGARPHLGCNAVDAGSAVVMAVNAIHVDPTAGMSVKVTQFHAGDGAPNIIPHRAVLVLDMRARRNPDMETLQQRVRRAVEHGAATVGASGELKLRGGCPAAEYDLDMIETVAKAIRVELGEQGCLPPLHTPGGDDFHFYTQYKPSLRTAFVGLGSDLSPGLHDPEMRFNPDVLASGANILVRTVEQILGDA